jgi:sigma-B regulation protein RsbU (phosphoserine phosphatase)
MTADTNHFEILIAEDQEHVREALAMLLRSHGYSVRQSSTPQEALSQAALQEVDLALVDMNYRRDSTSGIEGLNLIESLRQLDSTLPIVALTAWGNVDLAVNAMKSGASDFIEKPWRNQSLLEKVDLLASRGRDLRSQQRISEYERQDAQQVQMRIVPRRHIVAGGVEIIGESVPVGAVGGDYFGIWQPDAESLHLCIADVSGKGTPGALIAAMLHASVSTLAMSAGCPEKIVREVETILHDQVGEGHYITLIYGVIDLPSRTVEYVNAGHCPPIVRRSDGTIQTMGPTRPVLGLLDASDFRAEKLPLHPGDNLLLFTDGISEAANGEGEEFGAHRLRQQFDLPGELPARHAGLLQAVRDHASGKLADDATLVMLAVGGAASAQAALSVAPGWARTGS